jgi:hypothetical protein
MSLNQTDQKKRGIAPRKLPLVLRALAQLYVPVRSQRREQRVAGCPSVRIHRQTIEADAPGTAVTVRLRAAQDPVAWLNEIRLA